MGLIRRQKKRKKIFQRKIINFFSVMNRCLLDPLLKVYVQKEHLKFVKDGLSLKIDKDTRNYSILNALKNIIIYLYA